MLLESIEKSVNNKYMTKKNNDNKILFSDALKNNIEINGKHKVQQNQKTINDEQNNKNIINENKKEIIINKISTIDNKIINNKKENIHYNEITHGKNFIHDNENTIINNNFKILDDNFTNILRESVQNCFYWNFWRNDYIQ